VLARIGMALKLAAIWVFLIAFALFGTLRGIVRWTFGKLP